MTGRIVNHAIRKRSLHQATINFSENDYLGLCHDPVIKLGYLDGFRQFQHGSGGSIAVTGYHQPHFDLEEKFKKAYNVTGALLCPSGYIANLCILSWLKTLDTQPHLLIDKQCHASIYDGLFSSSLNYKRFNHNNPDDIVRKINAYPNTRFILTESIFSMSGFVTNLSQLSQHRPIILDEAHSFGILGPNGLGLAEQLQLSTQQIPIRMIAFGKAMAGMGAMIIGDECLIEALLQSARPLIYSTAMPPAIAAGLKVAFERLMEASQERQRLYHNIQYFKQQAQILMRQYNLYFLQSDSPIQFLRLGNILKSESISHQLKQFGILCLPIRPPTVAFKQTGLRIVLTSKHSESNIDQFFEYLVSCTI